MPNSITPVDSDQLPVWQLQLSSDEQGILTTSDWHIGVNFKNLHLQKRAGRSLAMITNYARERGLRLLLNGDGYENYPGYKQKHRRADAEVLRPALEPHFEQYPDSVALYEQDGNHDIELSKRRRRKLLGAEKHQKQQLPPFVQIQLGAHPDSTADSGPDVLLTHGHLQTLPTIWRIIREARAAAGYDPDDRTPWSAEEMNTVFTALNDGRLADEYAQYRDTRFQTYLEPVLHGAECICKGIKGKVARLFTDRTRKKNHALMVNSMMLAERSHSHISISGHNHTWQQAMSDDVVYANNGCIGQDNLLDTFTTVEPDSDQTWAVRTVQIDHDSNRTRVLTQSHVDNNGTPIHRTDGREILV